MKNKLADLNDHLFATLERLANESLSETELALEIKRAGAIDRVAGQVIAIGHLALDAAQHQGEYGHAVRAPRLLGLDGDNP